MASSIYHETNADKERPLAFPQQAAMNRVVFLLALSILINYIDRSNLSIAAPLLQEELHISNTQLGTLLSAFFWTYGLMQIPAGWLADRFDVKWVFAIGFFIWSTATAITGLLHGFIAFVLLRIILGVGESIVFPSCSNILGRHFAESRRGFANALLMTGLSLGPALGILVGGKAVGAFGWRAFFVALGLGGLLWLIPWIFWMPSRSAHYQHPASSEDVGIIPILRQRSAWGTSLGQFAVNYFLYFLLTWLPSYLKRGRGFTMDEVAKYGALLFLMSAISATVWGKLSDRWIKAGSTPTLVRKGTLLIGHIGIGIALVLTALSQGTVFIGMLAVTGVFLGIGCCSTWAVTQTLAGPTACGRWTGVQNFVGNMAGWVAPVVTGILVDRTGRYDLAFFITAAVAWFGALCWGVVVERVEPVKWDEIRSRRNATAPVSAGVSLP
jgi:MFS transporter, ACS family, D-galactonate transporter